MRRRRMAWVLLAAALLAGCSGPAGDSHPEWDQSWTRLGDLAAVEPLEDFALLEDMDALVASGLYYASWCSGQPREIDGAEGGTATAYDAQIYVLLEACGDAEAAGGEVAAWLAREEQNYDCGAPDSREIGGQRYTVLPLLASRAGNPYRGGAAAFGVRGTWAVSVEMVCGGGYQEDPQETLERFLAGVHYGNDADEG